MFKPLEQKSSGHIFFNLDSLPQKGSRLQVKNWAKIKINMRLKKRLI